MKVLLAILILTTLVSCKKGGRLDTEFYNLLLRNEDFDELLDGNDVNYDDPSYGNRRRYVSFKRLDRIRDGKSVIIRFTDRSLGNSTNTTVGSSSFFSKPGKEQLWAVDLSKYKFDRPFFEFIQNPLNRTRVFMVNPNTFTGTYISQEEEIFTISNWSRPQDGLGTPNYNELSIRAEGLFVDAKGKLYEASSDSTKDLESMGAKFESMEVAQMEDMLISFGLSTERAEKVARLANSYKKITSKRALNSREQDMFSKELLGVPFNQAAKEMMMDYDGLLERAADLNETSPEAIKELLNQIM